MPADGASEVRDRVSPIDIPVGVVDAVRSCRTTGWDLISAVRATPATRVGRVELDLSFLDVPLGSTLPASRPVNVYEILSEGWRETRVDMTLQFFLDPTERHGLGPMVLDALLRALDGAPVIGRHGRTATSFVAEDAIGSDAWEISTQAAYIDVFATNADLGIAVVIENKIGHQLNNPLDRYAQHALNTDQIAAVLVVVLAPERRTAKGSQGVWLSRAITYSELSEEIKRSPGLIEHLLSPASIDQRRSLDLLQQFFEARNGGMKMTDLSTEAARLNEWRDLLDTHGAAINQFLEARRRAGRLIRDRNKRLTPLIAERLEAVGLRVDWESHSGDNDRETWNAYHFPETDWSVELKLSLDPTMASIFVFDYSGRAYTHQTIEPLGLEWVTTDEGVADVFVVRVQYILEQVKQGLRSDAMS